MIPEKPCDQQALITLNGVDIGVGIDLARGAVVLHLPARQGDDPIMLSPEAAADLAWMIVGAAMQLRKLQLGDQEP